MDAGIARSVTEGGVYRGALCIGLRALARARFREAHPCVAGPRESDLEILRQAEHPYPFSRCTQLLVQSSQW